jgi:UPF0755 protein
VKRFLAVVISLSVLLGAVAAGFLFYAKSQLFSKRSVKVEIEVKKGETLKGAAGQVAEVFKVDPKLLYAYARWAGLKVKQGCYKLKGELSPAEALKELTTGKPCLKSFTIPPGSDLFLLDKLLSQQGVCKRGELLELSRSKAFLEKLGVPTLEGYLFPQTYYINREAGCKRAVEVAVGEFKRVVLPLFQNYTPPPLVKRALKKVTVEKVLTVASIVEKESSYPPERPLIAAVIYNRLIRGMKVQCDPTVIYALKLKGIFKERLLYRDLKTPSPYNTYYVKGLPPAPICNPSLNSIEAALHPANVKYLYFVSNGRGRHLFSKSYNEHLKKVRALRNGKETGS